MAGNPCFHCGEPVTPADVGRWPVSLDGQSRDSCCLGCQSVAQAIIDGGMAAYYRERGDTASPVPDGISQALDKLAVFDEPELTDRLVRPVAPYGGSSGLPSAGELVEANLAIDGMHCGACVWLLERAVMAQPGVISANFNFASERARIKWDPRQTRLSELLARISRVGYRATPFDASTREDSLRRQTRDLLQRLFVAGLGMMQVMMYALPNYLTETGDIEQPIEQLMRWAAMVLTTPVMLYSAQPFFAGAWRDVRARSLGMDVPVSIGLLAAFFASVWATLAGHGEIYFDSVTMFVCLLLAARYLEWAARRRNMRSLDALVAENPETARLLDDQDHEHLVPAARLRIGDIILVNTGERVPADAIVLDERSSVDQSILTGESEPITVSKGDPVPGGALLTGAPTRLHIQRPVADSALSVIERLIDAGADDKPQLLQLADRVASWFVAVLLLFALAVWVGWMMVDASKAWPTAIAVLVVSCPCALSLATPAALASATGALLSQRILIARGHALATFARVSDVVFDKTGTLTVGHPRVVDVALAADISEPMWLGLLARIEQGQNHPAALALREYAQSTGQAMSAQDLPPISGIEHQPGFGLRALVGAQEQAIEWRVGSARWCGLDTPQTSGPASGGDDSSYSEVFVATMPVSEGLGGGSQAKTGSPLTLTGSPRRATGSPLTPTGSPLTPTGSPLTPTGSPQKATVVARFRLADAIRDDAPDLIQHLRALGLNVHLLSGDRAAVVAAVASDLGIASWRADADPLAKQQWVKRLQAEGRVVAMVGDGVNDAPVLALADGSIAAGRATVLAQTAADTICLSPHIADIANVIVKAKATDRIIRQNLLWAVIYNLVAIPSAALGFVPPWAAAIGMASSSLIVVANAMRLRSN